MLEPDLKERWLELAEQRLRAAGYKAGAARTAVLDLLAREGSCLLAATEIVARVDGVASPASVYWSLETLHELGLVHRVDGNGVARYEVADPDRRHHHVVDVRTGEILAFEDAALERAIAAVAERLGLDLHGHDVVLRGRFVENESRFR